MFHDRSMKSARDVVDAHGGIARGTQLSAFGIDRKRTSDAVRRHEIDRIRRGVFATPRAPDAVRIAAAHGGSLTCATALRLHGIWVLHDDSTPHVWLGESGREHPHPGCHCVPHFHKGRGSLGLAPIENALVHAFRCYGAELFFCAFESAWNQRRIGPGSRARIRQSLSAADRWLVDFARSDAQSGLESLVRLRLYVHGIKVQTQVSIDGVGRVDFVIAGRVILEADGEGNHGGSHHRHRDLLRDAAASARGYETLRFDYDMIVRQWPVVIRAIKAALVRALG